MLLASVQTLTGVKHAKQNEATFRASKVVWVNEERTCAGMYDQSPLIGSCPLQRVFLKWCQHRSFHATSQVIAGGYPGTKDKGSKIISIGSGGFSGKGTDSANWHAGQVHTVWIRRSFPTVIRHMYQTFYLALKSSGQGTAETARHCVRQGEVVCGCFVCRKVIQIHV